MSLEAAIRIASNLPVIKGRQRLAAVISDKRGRVLSYSVNSYVKTHPIQAHYAKQVGKDCAQYLHAEIASLAALSYNDKQKAFRISIARVLKNGELGLSQPCSICQRALADFGIKCIEYTI